MNEKMIRDAYCRIRTIDNTIPDDVLDFMLEASLEKLNQTSIIFNHLKFIEPTEDVRAQMIGRQDRGLVIIGGQSGMGEANAKMIAEHNHNLLVSSIDPDKMGNPDKKYTIDELIKPAPTLITNRYNDGDTRKGDSEFLSGKQLRKLRREKKPKK